MCLPRGESFNFIAQRHTGGGGGGGDNAVWEGEWRESSKFWHMDWNKTSSDAPSICHDEILALVGSGEDRRKLLIQLKE